MLRPEGPALLSVDLHGDDYIPVSHHGLTQVDSPTWSAASPSELVIATSTPLGPCAADVRLDPGTKGSAVLHWRSGTPEGLFEAGSAEIDGPHLTTLRITLQPRGEQAAVGLTTSVLEFWIEAGDERVRLTPILVRRLQLLDGMKAPWREDRLNKDLPWILFLSEVCRIGQGSTSGKQLLARVMDWAWQQGQLQRLRYNGAPWLVCPDENEVVRLSRFLDGLLLPGDSAIYMDCRDAASVLALAASAAGVDCRVVEIESATLRDGVHALGVGPYREKLRYHFAVEHRGALYDLVYRAGGQTPSYRLTREQYGARIVGGEASERGLSLAGTDLDELDHAALRRLLVKTLPKALGLTPSEVSPPDKRAQLALTRGAVFRASVSTRGYLRFEGLEDPCPHTVPMHVSWAGKGVEYQVRMQGHLDRLLAVGRMQMGAVKTGLQHPGDECMHLSDRHLRVRRNERVFDVEGRGSSTHAGVVAVARLIDAALLQLETQRLSREPVDSTKGPRSVLALDDLAPDTVVLVRLRQDIPSVQFLDDKSISTEMEGPAVAEFLVLESGQRFTGKFRLE